VCVPQLADTLRATGRFSLETADGELVAAAEENRLLVLPRARIADRPMATFRAMRAFGGDATCVVLESAKPG
jgi:hypothetical protein